MYALSGCDTTSYPYEKGNVTTLNTIVSGNYQCLAIIGDIDTTHLELMNVAMPSFVSATSQPLVTSMESTRYNIFTKTKRNPKVVASPPTSGILLQHMLRAHLQIMRKAADCEGPAGEPRDTIIFG